MHILLSDSRINKYDQRPESVKKVSLNNKKNFVEQTGRKSDKILKEREEGK